MLKELVTGLWNPSFTHGRYLTSILTSWKLPPTTQPCVQACVMPVGPAQDNGLFHTLVHVTGDSLRPWGGQYVAVSGLAERC